MRQRASLGWNHFGLYALMGVVGLLWLSGVGLHHWLGIEDPFDLAPWEAVLRRAAQIAHGVLAWLACVLAGRWVWPHVQIGRYQRHRAAARWLGALTLVGGLGMALAGLVLLYGAAAWHDVASRVHWWIGLCWPVLLLLHLAWHAVQRRLGPWRMPSS